MKFKNKLLADLEVSLITEKSHENPWIIYGSNGVIRKGIEIYNL